MKCKKFIFFCLSSLWIMFWVSYRCTVFRILTIISVGLFALHYWFQVRLDEALADDAPFDICSCQVNAQSPLISIKQFFCHLISRKQFFCQFVKLLKYRLLVVEWHRLQLAVCHALFMVYWGAGTKGFGKCFRITSARRHLHRNNARCQCNRQKAQRRHVSLYYSSFSRIDNFTCLFTLLNG